MKTVMGVRSQFTKQVSHFTYKSNVKVNRIYFIPDPPSQKKTNASIF